MNPPQKLLSSLLVIASNNLPPKIYCENVFDVALNNAIDIKFGYRASNNVTVISLVEGGWFLLDKDNLFPIKEAGSLGSSNELSPCNIITTDDMLGRSS